MERPTRSSVGKRSAITGFLDVRFHCACVRRHVSTNGAKSLVLPVLLRRSGGSLYPRGQRSLLAAPPLDKGNEDSAWTRLIPELVRKTGSHAKKKSSGMETTQRLWVFDWGREWFQWWIFFDAWPSRDSIRNTLRDIKNVLNQFPLFVHFLLACWMLISKVC